MTVAQSLDFSHLLSAEAKSRRPEPLKGAFEGLKNIKHEVISLGGGLPVPDLFPFNNLHIDSLAAPFPRGINVVPESKEELLQYTISKNANHDSFDIPLATSLQYGSSAGTPNLLGFIKEHTQNFHAPPYEDWDAILSLGNTQAWNACIRTFCDRGDVILAERYTFAPAVASAEGNGVNVVPVETDLEGIVPEAFEIQMANWTGPMPKLLYTIPTGQNPTGGTESVERRKAIYKIAQKYGFMIIEDEPYYFLQMDSNTSDKPTSTPTHEDFMKSLVPSYLSLDTDGRVIRLDSYSKVIAPGSRLGWIVGQKRIIERVLLQHETTIQVTSGFSQTIINGLLHRWGQKGYVDWLIQLRKTYTHKRNVALNAIEEYIPHEIATWETPSAGMFFWIKIDGTKHPEFVSKLNSDPEALERKLFDSGIEQGTLLVPGHWFLVKEKGYSSKDGAAYFRGTFASAPDDQLKVGIKKFGDMLRGEFKLQ